MFCTATTKQQNQSSLFYFLCLFIYVHVTYDLTSSSCFQATDESIKVQNQVLLRVSMPPDPLG